MARRFAAGLPKRVAIIFLVMVACAGVLWLRLGYLQILRHPFLEAEAFASGIAPTSWCPTGAPCWTGTASRWP